jgi:hypothetical protein
VSQSSSDDEDDAPHSSGRGNIAAIIAVVVIAALGYWAFHTIDQQRKMQNCLDSGRRDCAHWVQ